MTADKDAFAAKLKALKDAYDAQLGGRIDALESALGDIDAANDGAGQTAAVRALLELAHKIAGSAGTFGHQKLSAAASELAAAEAAAAAGDGVVVLCRGHVVVSRFGRPQKIANRALVRPAYTA